METGWDSPGSQPARLPCWRDWGPEGAVASRPPARPAQSQSRLVIGAGIFVADDIPNLQARP